MAWTYYCNMDQTTLSAPDKDQLAEKVMQHMQQLHGKQMSREEAKESVEKNATQTAA